MKPIHAFIFIGCGIAACGGAQRYDRPAPQTYTDADAEAADGVGGTAASAENALERTYADREAIRVLRGRYAHARNGGARLAIAESQAVPAKPG